MIQIDETKLNEVVETALAKVKGNTRWTNAIVRAEKLLTSGNPMMHFDGQRLVLLSDSGAVYESNGTCQCRAFPMPCKHRAAFKLLKNLSELA